MPHGKVCLILTILLAAVLTSACAYAENDIGLYFDTSGTVNCLPDSTHYPFTTTAYLILRDCDSGTDVYGWDGALSLPQGIILLGADLGSGDSIEVTESEYKVRYSSPVAVTPAMRLASFRLSVSGPGEIYFHAIEEKAVKGSLAPVYFGSADEASLVEMDYACGSPLHPVATVGLPECPENPVGQALLVVGDIDLDPVPHDERMDGLECTVGGHQDRDGTAKNNDVEYLAMNSVIGLRGIVEGVEKDCYDDNGATVGLMKITLRVSEVYWGPSLEVVDVWVEGVDIPGCIKHGPVAGYHESRLVEKGVKLDVFAWYKGEAFWTSKYQIFLADNMEKPDQSLDRRLLLSAAENRSLNRRWSQSSFVGLLRAETSASGYVFSVASCLVGRKDLDGGGLRFLQPTSRGLWRASGEGEWPVLCFLKRHEDGTYRIGARSNSVLMRRPNGFFTPSGVPVDVLKLSEGN